MQGWQGEVLFKSVHSMLAARSRMNAVLRHSVSQRLGGFLLLG